MPRESRLDRLYNGLTALERAKLVLKTFHDDTREDPGWRMTMPPRQYDTFNGHIYTMNAANLFIANTINLLDADVEVMWERFIRVHMLVEWRVYVVEVEASLGRNAPSGPRQARHAAQDEQLVSVARLDEQCDELAESLVAGVGRMWPVMRAVEVGLEEMKASFDGNDPLKPVHRERLARVREDLTQLSECLEAYDYEVERPEPDGEALAIVRSTVPAMRYMMG